jgi:hypothetical protein
MAIYLVCLFKDAFNGFDYTVSNNNKLVIMRQKTNFICQQASYKGQEPLKNLNRDK